MVFSIPSLPFIMLVTAFAEIFSVQQKVSEPFITFEGRTMGTTYHISYFDERERNFQHSVDSLLLLINKSLSNYDPESEVSIFNRSENGIRYELPYLYYPLLKAREVFDKSDGAFDLTVMPLVGAWGFGPGKENIPEQKQIDSIKAFVGFEKVRIENNGVSKIDRRVQLDFGGIGQGYAVDVISDFLRARGMQDLLVELGGEGIAIGKNINQNRNWQIAILDPSSTPQNQFSKFYLSISNKAFTTSGNYFNYREKNGVRYGHTLDPSTGLPAKNKLLSASVFAKECITADAWATAFMVLGLERSISKVDGLKELEVIFIYATDSGDIKTYISPSLKSSIITEDQ